MQPMTPTTQELKQQFQQSMTLLKTLRDEIRVKVHLAGMEARDGWKQLEQRFPEAEHFAREASHTSRQALEDAIEAFKSFRDALAMKGPKRPS